MTYLIHDESPGTEALWAAIDPDTTDYTDLDATPSCLVSWDELLDANDLETMAEIAALAVGQETLLGQCDPIRRIS